ncbi:MAG: hypothetical protein HYS04_17260 [Acidobacteria bacterium]|nr:hypothetical protein [Acidobacteriota bacterium]
MLPLVFSISVGAPSAIPFDEQQELELLMTLGQSLVGLMFLVNMELTAWEASALFALWFVQFAFSPVPRDVGLLGFVATHIHEWVTWLYLIWAAIELVRIFLGQRQPLAFKLFAEVWRTRVRPAAPVS